MAGGRIAHWIDRLRRLFGNPARPGVHTSESAAREAAGQEPGPLAAARRPHDPKPPPAIVPGDQAVLHHPVIVFDLETSGLDMQHDTVLSVGAVRIENNAIPLADHIDAVLRVDAPLKPDSQLMHGLSREDLLRGEPAADALLELLAYGEGCIWLAFHAGFDRRMLDRALRLHLGIGFDQTVFDIAALAPMLFPEHDRPDAGLDHWARSFGLSTASRHTAAGDAMLTAEIALVLLHQAHRCGLETWKQLADALRQWERRLAAAGGPMA